MISSTPRIITELANSVLTLSANCDYTAGPGGPPRDYVLRALATRLAHDLRGYIKVHEDDTYDHWRDWYQRRVTGTLQAPLTREELISLLSRAYQAGRDGR